MTALDGVLERGKVDLAQRPLANLFIYYIPVGLLVVRDVVLYVRNDALTLHPLDERNRQLPGEKRVLSVSLEGAAILRHARDVYRRCLQQSISQIVRFAAGDCAIFLREVAIPGAGQCYRRRQRCGRLLWTSAAGACACGSVGDAEVGNAQPRNAEDDSIMGSIAEAVQLRNLFVQCHARDDVSSALLGGLRLQQSGQQQYKQSASHWSVCAETCLRRFDY